MAKSFPEVLVELGRQDPRVCGVSCDCWGFIAPLGDAFPGRAIEIGIAEQNLIGIGAGLALAGKMPWVIGMNPFVTMRCFEQIRTDLGYGCRNVKVIGGYGGGIGYGGWGCTHHAMEEIALMRLIPTMTVFFPADSYETEQATRAAAAIDGPCFISLAGGELPLGIPEGERQFTAGKASVLREGRDVTVISCGPAMTEALRGVELLTEKGVSARLLSMHTVKPLDTEAVLAAARETQLIITVEEHTVIGGLGGAVAETLAEAGAGTPLKRLGLQDTFACMVGSYEDVKQRHGISAQAVAQAAR
jgi:transketolase